MENELTKTYTNGEVTIVWKPSLCIHSTYCWRGEKGLPNVFNPKEKPWIKPHGADTQTIIEHIRQCPSTALSYYMNDAPEPVAESTVASETIVEPMANGPLMVYGNITIKDAAGHTIQKNKVTAFCRCGASGNKPYCDGSHVKIGFAG